MITKQFIACVGSVTRRRADVDLILLVTAAARAIAKVIRLEAFACDKRTVFDPFVTSFPKARIRACVH